MKINMKTSNNKNKNIYYYIGILILVAFLVFSRKGGEIKSAIDRVFLPLQSKIYTTRENLGKLSDNIFSYDEIIKENTTLKREKLFLESRIALLENDKRENERLKKILEVKEKNPTFKVGIVNFRQIEELFTKFSVNLGKNDGIEKDMVAIYEDNLIGKVSEVYDEHSIVDLITNETISLSATTGAGVLGIVKGSENNPGMLSYFPSVIQNDVKVGDEILTSGISDIFPKGLRIGKIISKDSDSNEFIVESYLDLTRLEEVILISKGGN